MGPFLTDEGESSPDLSEREGCRTGPASIYTNDYSTRTPMSVWTVMGIRKKTNFYWTIMVPPSSHPKLLYHVGHVDYVENQSPTSGYVFTCRPLFIFSDISKQRYLRVLQLKYIYIKKISRHLKIFTSSGNLGFLML